MVAIDLGAKREAEDMHHSCCACYLRGPDAGPSKEVIALYRETLKHGCVLWATVHNSAGQLYPPSLEDAICF